MKKSILILVMLLITKVSFSQDFTIDNVNYRVTSVANRTVEIIQSNEPPVELVIPATVSNDNITYTVTRLANFAFGFEDIESIEFPNTIRTIGQDAVSGNNLTNVTLPNSVIVVGFGAFRNNQLAEVTFGNNVTTIRARAFLDNALTSIVLPASVESIAQEAFKDNPNLVSVTSNNPNPPELIEDSEFPNDAFLNTANEIILNVPSGSEAAYIAAGWTDFFAINGEITDNAIGDRFTVDGITYEVVSGNPNAVKAVDNSNTGAVVIPSEVTFNTIEFNIIAIGEDAFRSNNITSVSIPEGVISIGDAAFFNNQLTNVSIPNSVTIIDRAAFQSNDLASITIPGGVTTIEEDAFRGNQLTSVTLPEGLVTIGDASFFDNQLTSVTIPNTVTIIDRAAFQSNNLTTFTIPGSVATIGGDAFRGNQLTSVTLSEGLVTIGDASFFDNQIASISIPNSVTTIERAAFDDNSLNSITLGNGVETIAEEAFRRNNITEVTLPASIATIGKGAFRGNLNLQKVVALGTTPAQIVTGDLVNDSFRDRSIIGLTVPPGVEEAYTTAGWTGFLAINGEVSNNSIGTTFTLGNIRYEITSASPNNVKAIDNFKTGSVTIPAIATFGTIDFNVTGIGASAFRENNLTRVVIPNSVITIERAAFFNNQLTNVTIPNSVTSLGDSAFLNNALTSVTISNSITTIEVDTFRNNNLSSITIPEGVTTIENAAFMNNALTSITIPENVTSIGDSAFRDNVDLTTVISESVTPPVLGNTNVFSNTASDKALFVPQGSEQDYIDNGWDFFSSINGSFSVGDMFIRFGITYLVTATSPNTVSIVDNINTGAVIIPENIVAINNESFTITSVGNDAFKNNNLTSVTIPDSVTEIDNNAFENNALTHVEIPNSITFIKGSTFSNNNLTSVTIPDSVIEIGEFAFFKNNLTSVTIPDSVTEIGDFAFRNNNLTSVTIPNSVTEIGRSAFRNNALASVEIPSSITIIGEGIFADNNLTSVTIPNSIITIEIDAFSNNELISVTIPNSVTRIEEAAFEDNALISVTIPDSVTEIGDFAFSNNNLTSVTIPNSVTEIGDAAFMVNQLKTVIVPNSVTSIGVSAFRANQLTSLILSNSISNLEITMFLNNPLTSLVVPPNVTNITDRIQGTGYESLRLLIAEGTVPLDLDSVILREERSNVDLVVPEGTIDAYLAAGWTGFKSITEANKGLFLNVLLQGASLNPNTGEEDLMRDDLRVAGLIPTTSPYTDAFTADDIIFDTDGSAAIVDWVLVQLRDANDSSIVIEEQSAFLLRDGSIVATDGVSNVVFSAVAGDYFVAIEHRNHLGILSANAITLSSVATPIDFTTDPSRIGGGENALIEIGDGIFGMVSGDFDENGQVQPSDVNATNAAIGTSSYTNADMDMNGQIQPADVNNLINPNIGRGIQFLARSVLSGVKSDQKNIEYLYVPEMKISDKK